MLSDMYTIKIFIVSKFEENEIKNMGKKDGEWFIYVNDFKWILANKGHSTKKLKYSLYIDGINGKYKNKKQTIPNFHLYLVHN